MYVIFTFLAIGTQTEPNCHIFTDIKKAPTLESIDTSIFYGATERNRTADLLITNQLLYR